MKTNAVRLIEQQKINYELREYELSEDELDAITVANKIGMAPESVFKTLVARGDRSGIVMGCVPANAEIDLKKLAAASGNKSVELVAVREIQALTGYIRGGVSPLGTKKHYPLFVDQTVLQLKTISVSAGKRGVQVLLAPEDLVRVSSAKVTDLTRSREDGKEEKTEPRSGEGF